MIESVDWKNKKQVLEVVQQNGWLLQFACSSLRNHPEVVRAAVKQDGRALQFASLGLKNNFEIVFSAVKQTRKALEYASQEIKNNRQLVRELLAQADKELTQVSKVLVLRTPEEEFKELVAKSKDEVRTTQLMIHAKGESLCSSLVTKIQIVGDGTAEYLEIEQLPIQGCGKMKITQSNWPLLRATISRMLSDCRE